MDGSEPVRYYRRYERWRWFKGALIALLGFFLISITPLVYLLEPLVKAGFFLVAGWIWFLARVVPEMQFNWAAIGMFLFCSTLVIGGLQWFGRTLAEKGGWTWSRRWPWGIYLGCWILFLAAMGFTGAVHQTGWLINSGEPWVQNRFRKLYGQIDLNSAGTSVQIALSETQETPDQMRAAIDNGSRPHRDTCTVLCFPADAGPVRTVLVLPRSPEVLRRFGFVRIEADGSSVKVPADQLAPTLDLLNAGSFELLPQP
jgi:hypothetical protein